MTGPAGRPRRTSKSSIYVHLAQLSQPKDVVGIMGDVQVNTMPRTHHPFRIGHSERWSKRSSNRHNMHGTG